MLMTPAKKLEDILEWLSPGTHFKTHEDKRAEKAEDTGDWFLNSKPFQDWINGHSFNLLFCHGKGISYDAILLTGLSWSWQVYFKVPSCFAAD